MSRAFEAAVHESLFGSDGRQTFDLRERGRERGPVVRVLMYRLDAHDSVAL
jgi:hypothetical protein